MLPTTSKSFTPLAEAKDKSGVLRPDAVQIYDIYHGDSSCLKGVQELDLSLDYDEDCDSLQNLRLHGTNVTKLDLTSPHLDERVIPILCDTLKDTRVTRVLINDRVESSPEFAKLQKVLDANKEDPTQRCKP